MRRFKSLLLASSLSTSLLLAYPFSASAYQVRSGDTLWTIAQRYGVAVSSLTDANGLSSDSLLHIGQHLTIPGEGAVSGQGSATGYTVQSGDTLWTIAERYGVAVSSLTDANGLSSGSLLHIGQRLTIPGHSTPAVSYDGPTTGYTVQSGDTLWTIAERYGTSVTVLTSVNDLGSENLRIGQILRVPGGTSPAAAASPASFTAPVEVSRTASPASSTAPTEVSRDLGPFDRVIGYALALQGVPYRWGGTSPAGFDCSGLVQYVFRKAGINLPRTTWDQYTVGAPVAENQLQPGDLVFFNTYGPISHDGVYIGNGHFISSTSSDGVAVRNLNDGYWGPRYAGARRL